jgi:hypothetical protein
MASEGEATRMVNQKLVIYSPSSGLEFSRLRSLDFWVSSKHRICFKTYREMSLKIAMFNHCYYVLSCME